MTFNWDAADFLAHEINDLIQQRVLSGTSPLQIWVGQLLALKAFMKTAPYGSAPTFFRSIESSIDSALAEILREAAARKAGM